jgi:hypothetical protein
VRTSESQSNIVALSDIRRSRHRAFAIEAMRVALSDTQTEEGGTDADRS